MRLRSLSYVAASLLLASLGSGSAVAERVCDDLMCWPPSYTPPSPGLHALDRIEIHIAQPPTGAYIFTNVCPVTSRGLNDGCGQSEPKTQANLVFVGPDRCTSTAVYSDGARTSGSCRFAKLNPDGTIADVYGGMDISLVNPATVHPQGCFDFGYTLRARNSTLAFVDAANNVWAIGAAVPSEQVGELKASGYVPVSSAGSQSWTSSLSLDGAAVDSNNSTKTIRISLSGVLMSSQSCLSASVYEFSADLSGTGVVR